MLGEQHYYPDSAGYERWRAIGYKMEPVAQPAPKPAAEAPRGITMSPEDLTQMIHSIVTQINQGVSTGVGTTLQSAAMLASMMQQQTMPDNSRGSFPVQGTNNVLVSISSPPIANVPTAAIAGPSNVAPLSYSLVPAPVKNYNSLPDYESEDEEENSPPPTTQQEKTDQKAGKDTADTDMAMEMEQVVLNLMEKVDQGDGNIDVEMRDVDTVMNVADQIIQPAVDQMNEVSIGVSENAAAGGSSQSGRLLRTGAIPKKHKPINFIRDEATHLSVVLPENQKADMPGLVPATKSG